MKIKAAVITEKSGPFIFKDVELDEPQDDEILVKMVATGVCQTDAHIREQSYETPLPIVLGHEGAGIVVRTGKKVANISPGDHVIMSYPSCGVCNQCMSGASPYCKHGFELSFGGHRLDGTNAMHDGIHGHFFGQSSFATYAIANQRNVVKVPKDVPLKLLGPLGCGFQTGAGTVLNALKVNAGSSVAVFGTGSVGLAAIMAANLAGATTIVAVDINPERLRLATELGATHTVNGKDKDIVNQFMAISPGGVDYIVEVTALPGMIEIALDVLGMPGEMALIGGAPTGTKASFDLNRLLNGRSVKGVIQGSAIPQVFIPQLIDLYKEGKFPFDKLVSYYPYEDIEQAFTDTRSGKVIKPILVF
ncbi:NAD(P)-dependent alcohol dehydrogenase [Serratia marcescens]|uniref:NAD(P)-dependent alcohol dehydrogenase n=1 Tax=Serratia marcescens TaxID=615 RepID=UPI00332D9C7B